ncbi:MAG: D-Ala-D-Ala carboxypeptidase family metallohydrolase [Filomicrobium sp.]
MKMSIKGSLPVLAALFLAFSGLMATNNTANAASTGCLPASVKAKLNQIRAKFGPVRVISTHRPGARIAGSGKRSFHASCRAVDFHPPRGKYRQVVAWLKKNHSGGVGTYSCGMHHIHIDNGPRVRFHHCVNARGRPVGKKRRYASKRRYKKKYAKRYSKRRYSKRRSAKRYTKNYRSKKRYSKKKYTRKSYKKRYSKKSTKKRYSKNSTSKRTSG